MAATMMSAYAQLEQLYLQIYHFQHLLSLAFWDANVKMPPKGSQARGTAIAELQKHVHEILTDDGTAALLDEAEADSNTLTQVQRANLREMRRMWKTESMLPAEFVQWKGRLTTEAQTIWVKCRAANDFAGFLPTLEELVKLFRAEARHRAGDSGQPLYEAMLHVYEPGMSLDHLDAIFKEVKSWLPKLLRDVLERQKEIAGRVTQPRTPLPVEQQEALGRHLMRVWQYDFDAGRLDISAHPFTGMTMEDTRVTTAYNTEDYGKALFATIHETGHAKYEMNCGPREMLGQPVCAFRSLGVHESQSLFAERVIGRSRSFAEFLTPLLIEHLGPQPAFTPENVTYLNQHVEPRHIRIISDEVSYTLHIILRYEIERALIEGTLEAADVPRVWNEKMKAYLGLETLGRDDLGCLQDVHWCFGSFGYFPTYSIGAMLAAQLMATIKKELGEETVDKCIRTGDLGPIFAKQKEKIWSQGCLYETEDLIRKATGEPLNPRYFREHLERRYLRNED